MKKILYNKRIDTTLERMSRITNYCRNKRNVDRMLLDILTTGGDNYCIVSMEGIIGYPSRPHFVNIRINLDIANTLEKFRFALDAGCRKAKDESNEGIILFGEGMARVKLFSFNKEEEKLYSRGVDLSDLYIEFWEDEFR